MDVGQYDGDGLTVKPACAARYYLRSSVLNGLSISEVFSELKPESVSGGKASSFVYLNGEVIVEQFTSESLDSPPQQLKWRRRDPARTSIHFQDEWNLPTSTGAMVQLATDIQGVATESPDYVRLQQQSAYYNQSYSSYNYGADGYGSGSYRSSSYGATGGMPGNFGTGCSVQGMLTPCSIAMQGFNNGSLAIDPRHFSYGWNRPPILDLPINSPVSFLFSPGAGGMGVVEDW